jgi:hypothetical protein
MLELHGADHLCSTTRHKNMTISVEKVLLGASGAGGGAATTFMAFYTATGGAVGATSLNLRGFAPTNDEGFIINTYVGGSGSVARNLTFKIDKYGAVQWTRSFYIGASGGGDTLPESENGGNTVTASVSGTQYVYSSYSVNYPASSNNGISVAVLNSSTGATSNTSEWWRSGWTVSNGSNPAVNYIGNKLLFGFSPYEQPPFQPGYTYYGILVCDLPAMTTTYHTDMAARPSLDYPQATCFDQGTGSPAGSYNRWYVCGGSYTSSFSEVEMTFMMGIGASPQYTWTYPTGSGSNKIISIVWDQTNSRIWSLANYENGPAAVVVGFNSTGTIQRVERLTYSSQGGVVQNLMGCAQALSGGSLIVPWCTASGTQLNFISKYTTGTTTWSWHRSINHGSSTAQQTAYNSTGDKFGYATEFTNTSSVTGIFVLVGKDTGVGTGTYTIGGKSVTYASASPTVNNTSPYGSPTNPFSFVASGYTNIGSNNTSVTAPTVAKTTVAI